MDMYPRPTQTNWIFFLAGVKLGYGYDIVTIPRRNRKKGVWVGRQRLVFALENKLHRQKIILIMGYYFALFWCFSSKILSKGTKIDQNTS